MSKTTRTLAILAAAAMAIMGASGDVITIPENGTFIMGGTGDDPVNKRSNYIVFEPGSTLVVTQIGNNVTIWPVVVATNGAATVRGVVGRSMNISNHMFVFGEGSLTIEDTDYAVIGHVSYLPTLKIDNLKCGDGVGPSAVMSSSVIGFPTDSSAWVLSSSDEYVVRLFGDTDMFPDKDTITVNRCQLRLCNPAAIPAGKTVKVSKGKVFSVSPLVLPDYRDGILDKWPQGDRSTVATAPVTYSCDVSLAAGAKLRFANAADVVFDGTISSAKAGGDSACSMELAGYKGAAAPVVLAADNSGFAGNIVQTVPHASLVLSNANAAANATLVSDGTLSVRGAEGIGAVSVAGVSGGAGLAGCVLRAAEGQSFSVSAGADDVIPLSGEGTFSVDTAKVLEESVSWWFDFSRADTRFRIGEGTTDKYRDRETSNHEPYVEHVVDWRYPDAANSLWNRRMYHDGYDTSLSVYPYAKTDENSGLQYITMEGATSSRRLPFSNGTGYNSKTYCIAQLAVLLFGAQNGGGHAVVGTENGAFGRAGTTINDGSTTNTMHDIWQNGVKLADPTTAKFKSGFQIISVAIDGLKFNGLGFLKNLEGNRGGQNYGEVLIFTNAVSERVRLEAEWYLAKKWGLESQYDAGAKSRLEELRAANPVRIEATGSPTINLGKDIVEVGGPFSGTVNLGGGKLLVPDRSLPGTEVDVPSAGRLYWADPDDDGAVLRYGDLKKSDSAARTNEVRALKDKVARAFTAGEPALYGMGQRMPSVVRQSLGAGPERGWLDFNDITDNGTDGNCLRFLEYPSDSSVVSSLNNGGNQASLLTSLPVRTAFFVMDSRRGGGNPLLDTVNGSSTGVGRRTQNAPEETIWPGDRPAEFVGGENRLNGEVVDYTKGFTGKPEVFTVRGTAGHDSSFVGCYWNTENGVPNGEIIGEMLFYSTALDESAVKKIESYLMDKWLGWLPQGYADIRKATVTGSGTVEAAVAAQMPTIGQGFEGTVKVDDGAFVMTVDIASGAIYGSLDCPLATLDLPQNCSITLNFTEHPPKPQDAVVLTLVNCADGLDGVTWTFASGENAPDGAFVKEGNKVLYRYASKGSIFLMR